MKKNVLSVRCTTGWRGVFLFWPLAFGFWLLAFGFWPLAFGGAGRGVVVHLFFSPCRGRLTFFVLPKKVSKERRARDGDPLLGFLSRGGEGAKLAALRQGSFLFPPRNKNPRRHQGQERQRPHRRCAGLGGTVLLLLLLALLRAVLWVPAARVIDGLAFDVPALCGALNFCCKEEKGRETV
ncbi:hypothetical protein [Ralstonia pickettii]|uniref:hypothetical protein n=1 Tax=Ralstonia pickettii TaxID=329 RepID=UPI0015DDAD09|nr:hypothetical protein [Ralstonia pickettii]